MCKHPRFLAFLAALAALSGPSTAATPEHNPVAREPRVSSAPAGLDVIVKLRPEAASSRVQKPSSNPDRNAALAKRTGVALALKREISESMLASRIELRDADPADVLRKLRADPQVEYVAPDHRRYAHASPNDALFAGQWYLQGWCHLREAMRTFHLDRVSDLELTDIPITHAGEPARGWFESGEGDMVVRIRFDESVGPLLGVPPHEHEAWVGGFEFLQMLRLHGQLDGTTVGDSPNRIAVDTLNDIDRRILKETLRVLRSLQQRLRLDYER